MIVLYYFILLYISVDSATTLTSMYIFKQTLIDLRAGASRIDYTAVLIKIMINYG